jgi:hypothetical protein
MDTTLHWGPCDGDVVIVEDLDREIRIPVICGICLDDLPTNLDKALYTEAMYIGKTVQRIGTRHSPLRQRISG